jgi:hypothetical protein
VLAGNVGVEQAAQAAGFNISVPFALVVLMQYKVKLMSNLSNYCSALLMVLETGKTGSQHTS